MYNYNATLSKLFDEKYCICINHVAVGMPVSKESGELLLHWIHDSLPEILDVIEHNSGEIEELKKTIDVLEKENLALENEIVTLVDSFKDA